MISTVLFDADGVLITGKKFSDHLAEDLNISEDMTTSFFNGPFKQCLIGKADLKKEISPFLTQWGWNKSVNEFLELWFTVEHHLNEPLLKYIQNVRSKGLNCYIATNQEKYRSQYMKEFMELGPLFDGVFASNEIGVCKPDPAFYQFIIENLSIPPENILFWDDTERNIDAAKKEGIHAEHYSTLDDFTERMKYYESMK